MSREEQRAARQREREAEYEERMRTRAAERAARQDARDRGVPYVAGHAVPAARNLSREAALFRAGADTIKVETATGAQVLYVGKRGLELTRKSSVGGERLPWSDITDLVVEGPESAEKTVSGGRVLALGMLALAAPKNTSSTSIIVKLDGGVRWTLTARGLTAPQVRATVALHRPIVTSVMEDTRPAAELSDAEDVPTALERLARLHSDGMLTPEEFGRAKALVLGPQSPA